MAGPIQAPSFGRVLKITGMAVVAFGFILPVAAIEFLLLDPKLSIPFVIWRAVPLGALLCWRGRQHEARAWAQEIITASKGHVLLLHPFLLDQQTITCRQLAKHLRKEMP